MSHMTSNQAQRYALADSLRSLVFDALLDKYQIAQNPGPDTIVSHLR